MKAAPFLVVAALAAAALLGYVVYDAVRTDRLDRHIRAHGRPAEATVVSARQTGSWVANNPELALVLTVREAGRPPREQRAEKVVPVTAAGLFQPGAVMRLRIHPENPTAFVFDEPWDAPDDQ